MYFCENPGVFGPCGRCRACRLSQATKKMITSIFASDLYKKQGQFLTLTFNDDFVPEELDHSIFSGFMKRLRSFDDTPDVKFFMCGEYGEKTHRPHFHVLFYNHKYDIDDIKRAWIDVSSGEPLGFVYDGTLSPGSIKYVSGYVSKKGYEPGSDKKPPYGRSSCSIPDGLTDREIENMCRTGKIKYNGRSYAVPDVWRRRYADVWKKYRFKRFYDRQKKLFEHYIDDFKRLGNDEKVRVEMDNYSNFVSQKMDHRDRVRSVKKSEREKKRLQKLLKRRIM